MAKKKTSKKSSKKSLNILSYVKYGAIAFAVIGLIMTVCTFVTYDAKLLPTSYTGIQQIFGYSKTTKTILDSNTVEYLSFSFMTLLAVILPLIGSISVLFKNKIIRAVGVVVMIVGCVLTFLAPNFIVFAGEFAKSYSLVANGIGIGAILAGTFFGIGALCNLFAVVEK